jgi:hypothetical protein
VQDPEVLSPSTESLRFEDRNDQEGAAMGASVGW